MKMLEPKIKEQSKTVFMVHVVEVTAFNEKCTLQQQKKSHAGVVPQFLQKFKLQRWTYTE